MRPPQYTVKDSRWTGCSFEFDFRWSFGYRTVQCSSLSADWALENLSSPWDSRGLDFVRASWTFISQWFVLQKDIRWLRCSAIFVRTFRWEHAARRCCDGSALNHHLGYSWFCACRLLLYCFLKPTRKIRNCLSGASGGRLWLLKIFERRQRQSRPTSAFEAPQSSFHCDSTSYWGRSWLWNRHLWEIPYQISICNLWTSSFYRFVISKLENLYLILIIISFC